MAIFGGVAHQSLNLQGLEVAFIASNRIQEMACLMEWEHTDHLHLQRHLLFYLNVTQSSSKVTRNLVSFKVDSQFIKCTASHY
mgnify:CR=1 FL=1